jgi:hypothetical protein
VPDPAPSPRLVCGRHADIFLAQVTSPSAMYFGDGNGGFVEAPNTVSTHCGYHGGVYTRMTAILDANGDTHPDMVRLARNMQTNSRYWYILRSHIHPSNWCMCVFRVLVASTSHKATGPIACTSELETERSRKSPRALWPRSTQAKLPSRASYHDALCTRHSRHLASAPPPSRSISLLSELTRVLC